MELKKNPNVDPKRNSTLFFQVGLAAVLLLTFVGIELKSADPVIETEKLNLVDNFVDDEEMILTLPPVQKLPPPPPPAPEVIQVVEDKIILEDKKIETTEVDEKKPVVVVKASEVGEAGDDYSDLPDELPFAVIENIPVFPGCEGLPKNKQADCFNEKMNAHINKHFSYPARAAEENIQGRVQVQFVIDKQGNVTDVRVRGPKGGELLEKEAERIISKLPRFTPGKQRNQPVKVRYAQPINFKLK